MPNQGHPSRWIRHSHLRGSVAHTFATGTDSALPFRFNIGAALDNSNPIGMDVAAVLAYNRALSDAELAQLVAYLST